MPCLPPVWILQLAAVQALLDEMGAEKGCLAVNQVGQCIIGRQEAFYIYTPDGRGPCFVFEGGLAIVQAAWSHPAAALQVGRKRWHGFAGQAGSSVACLLCLERKDFPLLLQEGVSPICRGVCMVSAWLPL